MTQGMAQRSISQSQSVPLLNSQYPKPSQALFSDLYLRFRIQDDMKVSDHTGGSEHRGLDLTRSALSSTQRNSGGLQVD
jgi:hypothetical protein